MSHHMREIAFIDPAIDGIDVIRAGLRPGVEGIVLTATEPAPQQMARALDGRDGLEAIHVIAHGAPGEVRFAAGALSADGIAAARDGLAGLGRSLRHGGGIALWSCHAGAGAAGAALLGALSAAAGAPAAASTALVGAAARGGRWELDCSAGTRPVRAPLTDAGVAAYQGVMGTTYTWVGTTTGWATTGNWSPNGTPGPNDDVIIGTATKNPILGSGSAATVNSVTITAGAALTVNGTLAATNGITLQGGTLGGSGSISPATTVTGSGTVKISVAGLKVTASGGTLDVTGTMDTNTQLSIADVAAGSVLKINYEGVTINALTLSKATQTLEIAKSATISSAQTITNGTLIVDSGATLTDTAGIVLAGGTLSGFGLLGAGTKVTGSGTVSISVVGDAVRASGSTLDVTGAMDTTTVLSIDDTSASVLKIDHSGATISALTLTNATQTLEIAKSATISGAQTIFAATVLVDSGAILTDAAGIMLAGGTLSGGGSLSGPASAGGATSLTGWGTVSLSVANRVVTARDGVLDLQGAMGSATLSIADVHGSVLKIDASGATIKAVAVDTANKTLEIAQNATIVGSETVTGGVLQLDGVTLTNGAGVTLDLKGRLIGSGTAGAVTLAGGTITPSGGTLALGDITGYGTVDGSPVVSGTITASGGVLEFTGPVTGAETFSIANVAGSVLKFDGSVASGSSIMFAGSGTNDRVLDLTAIGLDDFNGIIGNMLNVKEGILVKNAASAIFDGINNTLTVYDSNDKLLGKLTFAESHTKDYFHIVNGDEIVICFMPGTLIATPDGARAVETLSIDDLVLTASGEARPVRWIGRNTVSLVFGDPLRVLPIRITAGALGEHMPVRDLLLSPDHAVLVDGVLIQAGALVNGTTIRREEDVPTVFTYYHVELDEHALILAEGVPAETFVDNVDRMGFDNWDEFLALNPEGREIAEMELPRAKAHRQVPMATRARLAARAATLRPAVAAA